MSRTAASLLREALENVRVRHTFGIPGVHNTEIYDDLARSPTITPVLVTHEGAAAFTADAVSRCGTSLGTLVIVPAAGVTHAANGIAEAHLDGIPMLVIAGGIRRDTGRRYQLHDLDQHAFLKPITKGTWLVERHADAIPTIYEAVRAATSGEPGPVFVEIPVNPQLIAGEEGRVPPWGSPVAAEVHCSAADVAEAAQLLAGAASPGLFVGWGAVDASAEVAALAERLGAPVSTTLQGLSAFPADHPLHAGAGHGRHRPAGPGRCPGGLLQTHPLHRRHRADQPGAVRPWHEGAPRRAGALAARHRLNAARDPLRTTPVVAWTRQPSPFTTLTTIAP